jgi:GNAT superfamily N-acetyltransferase
MSLENVEIRPICNNDMFDFREMFCTYFRNDFKIEITDNEVEELCHEIAESSFAEITSLDMLLIHGEFVGFISYQIDNSKSDWCEREGWGFIRELYINHSFRRKGLGAKLVAHAEKALYVKGAEHIYLTSDEAGEFWRLCGYKETAEVSNINHDPIYEKLK